MQMEGLIPFKSSIDHAIASLYFMRILINFYFFSSIKSTTMIIGLDLSLSKKAYFRCLGNSIKIKPLKLFSTSCAFSSLLLTDFLIHNWHLDIQHQETQYTENSSHSHSLNS